MYGVSTQPEAMNIIRTECVDEEVAKIKDIMSEWRKAAGHFQKIIRQEKGIADQIKTDKVDDSQPEMLHTISSDILFQQAFSQLQKGPPRDHAAGKPERGLLTFSWPHDSSAEGWVDQVLAMHIHRLWYLLD